MILHVCDRCRRELTEDNVKRSYSYTVDHTNQFLEPVELCERCMKDLDKFMKGQTVFAYGDDTITSNQAD